MSQEPTTGLNRAKPYQLVLFPLNNGATNVYYVLILSYIATFGSAVLGIAITFASVMVTGMRLFDAVTDPIIGALMDKTNGRFGKFRPFMVIGSIIMAVSVVCLYVLTPFVPASMMGKLYQTARCPKRFLWMPGAGHAACVGADPEMYWSAVSSFLQSFLPEAPSP